MTDQDPAQLRISDAERHQVAEVLREAAGEGRLELSELDERLEATYAARTYADLLPITADLPTGGTPPLPVPRPGATPATRPGASVPAGPVTRYDSSIAIMNGVDRKGRWEVGPTHNAVAVMGGVTIDLREAVFTGQETVITVNAFWAGVDVVVNEHTRVIVDGVGIAGTFEQARDKVEPQLTDASPVVRVRGVSLMAAVTVVRKGPPRLKRRERRQLH